MKIPRDDPRARHMSGNRIVDRDGLAAFLADKHRWVLATTRRDGRSSAERAGKRSTETTATRPWPATP